MLVGEEVWQIEFDAHHCRSCSLMGVICILSHRILSAFIQERLPLVLPLLGVSLKIIFFSIFQSAHQLLKFLTCKQFRIFCNLTSDNGAHVIMAHLYLITGKHFEQALNTIYHHSIQDVAILFNLTNCIYIVRHMLMVNEFYIKRFAGIRVQCGNDTAIATKVGCINVDYAVSADFRVMPFNGDAL